MSRYRAPQPFSEESRTNAREMRSQKSYIVFRPQYTRVMLVVLMRSLLGVVEQTTTSERERERE